MSRGGWQRPPAAVLRLLLLLLAVSAVVLLLHGAVGGDVPTSWRLAAVGALVLGLSMWLWLDHVSPKDSTGIPLIAAAALCVLGLTAVAVFAFGLWPSEVVMPAGALSLYLGGGELVTRWRNRTRPAVAVAI